MRPKVYLAGAITGLNYDESEDWRKQAKQLLDTVGIAGFSPLRQKEYLRNQGELEGSYDFKPLSTARGIMTRDFNDVQTSDALLIGIYGTTKVSVGTAMEAGWAWMMHKPTVVWAEEENIHLVHPMFRETVSYRVDSLEDAVHTISSILLP
jgi:nucleoside 2-deoxyribosyltransferase